MNKAKYRKYVFNEHYFDKIDTEEKAYFLGFLYADGCNKDNRNLCLFLAEQDKEILYKFNKLLDSDKKLVFYQKRCDNCQNQWGISLHSQYICHALTKLGCPPRKSLILKFPTQQQVPEHLIRHFIRGYFDGDGCIRFSKIKKNHRETAFISIDGTKEFCSSLKKIIYNKFGLNLGISVRHPDRKNNHVFISNGGNRLCQTILDWLYRDSSIYLKRKYEKYLYLIEINKINKNRKGKYLVTYINGVVQEVDDIISFCLDNGYDRTCLNNLKNKKQKYHKNIIGFAKIAM